MKKFSLYIFQAVFCMVLFISCDKAAEENTAGYSTFYLSMPTFSSAGGEKTHWDSQGLWWDESGDVVSINGDQHQIVYSDGAWRTTGGTSTAPVNDQYYICYMGKGIQDGAYLDPNNKVYTNVDLTGIVPLVGVGKTNKITLQPCCAVLKVSGLPQGKQASSFVLTVDGAYFPSGKCTVDPSNALITSSYTTTNAINHDGSYSGLVTDAYFVLPMVNDYLNLTQITLTLTKKNNQVTTKTTNSSVRIDKGKVYTITW